MGSAFLVKKKNLYKLTNVYNDSDINDVRLFSRNNIFFLKMSIDKFVQVSDRLATVSIL